MNFHILAKCLGFSGQFSCSDFTEKRSRDLKVIEVMAKPARSHEKFQFS